MVANTVNSNQEGPMPVPQFTGLDTAFGSCLMNFDSKERLTESIDGLYCVYGSRLSSPSQYFFLRSLISLRAQRR